MTAIELPGALLTIPEIAPVFRKSEATIRRWIADGTMPITPVVIAGRHYFKAADVEQFLGKVIFVTRAAS